MTNKTEWAYCPECGCEDVRHEEGEHKQCAICHQEWFSSVDYSDVVRKHLSGKYIDKDAEIERLRAQVSAGAGHVLAYKLSRQRLLGRARERELALIGLRTKMADGIAFVQNLCNAAGSQPSVATGYLRDILDVLSAGADSVPASVVLPDSGELSLLVARSAGQADRLHGCNHYTACQMTANNLMDRIKELNS